jgi:hypothetical protein
LHAPVLVQRDDGDQLTRVAAAAAGGVDLEPVNLVFVFVTCAVGGPYDVHTDVPSVGLYAYAAADVA